MTRGQAHIGMAGWVYPDWRGGFYPAGLAQKNELAYAASQVTSIELNGSFYSLQKPSSWQRWHDSTPDGFVFSVKAPKFITHIRRLDNVHEALANFFASGILSLGAKLGTILWQLPPSLEFEPYLLEQFLRQLPHSSTEALALAQERGARMSGKEYLQIDADRPIRHALEVRHSSFASDAFVELLTRYRAAAVYGDSAGKWPVIDVVTADFRYARLHADTALYPDGWYEPADLDRWADTVEGWLDGGLDAYVYFDNDSKVRAPFDAVSFITRMRA
ncbi:MAG: DUF72 domain-containing protein [Rhodoglobus sp.]